MPNNLESNLGTAKCKKCVCVVSSILIYSHFPYRYQIRHRFHQLADAVSVAGVGDHDPLSSMMTPGSMSYNLIFRLSDYRIGVNHPV